MIRFCVHVALCVGSVAVVHPTGGSPQNSPGAGPNVTGGASNPAPDSGTRWGLPASLVLISRLCELVPLSTAVYLTTMVQLWPAASVSAAYWETVHSQWPYVVLGGKGYRQAPPPLQ